MNGRSASSGKRPAARVRAPCVRARPAAARSLRRAGGEGEGQVSVCGSRVPARGFPPPLPPDPNLGLGGGSSAFPWSAFFFVPHFLPSHLPFRPSTRFLPSTADCHSGVLFPGRGDLWGEGTATGSRPWACSPHHAALTRGRHACGTQARKPSSVRMGPPQVLPALLLQALLLPRFFQNPNPNLPLHPLLAI